MNPDARILVTGGHGMLGSAVVRLLRNEGFGNVLVPSRAELELTDRAAVLNWFDRNRPEHVLMIAAKVGGIAANIADPVGFSDVNLRLTLNLFEACRLVQTKKNLFPGSSCIYPVGRSRAIPEEALLTGPLEPTNEGYALSKIVGLKLARYYFEQYGLLTVCPIFCNLYGTGDDFDLSRAHVLSALVRRFVDAREDRRPSVTLWGTGAARREFLHVDDAARAVLFFMENVTTPEHVNVGAGSDISIRELATRIAAAARYRGAIKWDTSKPDGMLRKLMDVSKAEKLGFRPSVGLDEGIARTVAEYEKGRANHIILNR